MKKLFNPLFDNELSYNKENIISKSQEIAPTLNIKSNFREYENLTNSLNLKEVLVGRFGKPPIRALADLGQRVCVPLIELK